MYRIIREDPDGSTLTLLRMHLLGIPTWAEMPTAEQPSKVFRGDEFASFKTRLAAVRHGRKLGIYPYSRKVRIVREVGK